MPFAAGDAVITDGVQILAILLGVMAGLFLFRKTAVGTRVFGILPLLLFAYFVPTLLSNTGLIPIQADIYGTVKNYFLPASLFLLVLTVDIPTFIRLGPYALILFFAATISIVLGGPLAYLICSGVIPEELGEDAWRGLAALSGSWIGGTANMVALQDNFGASASIMGLIIVIDVAVANVWMAFLLFFAGRDKAMDDKMGAHRESIDEVRDKVSAYQAEVARPTSMPDLFLMLFLAFGATVVGRLLGYEILPTGEYATSFTWVILFVSFVGITLSFTRLRRLEGAGASAMGSLFLYLLVGTIGAKAEFAKIVEAPELLIVGGVWMLFHVIVMMVVRRIIKAPIFFVAVGSKANIGGAASAPIVASAFHPSLAAVGVLLATFGYFIGTPAGLLCGNLIRWVAQTF